LERAERWLREGLPAAGLNEKELAATPGSDPRKVALARLLRRDTTVSQVWLAERLAMRSAANVSQQLRRVGTERIKGNLPKSLASFVERVGGRDQRLSIFAH
jgi:putative transposase